LWQGLEHVPGAVFLPHWMQHAPGRESSTRMSSTMEHDLTLKTSLQQDESMHLLLTNI